MGSSHCEDDDDDNDSVVISFCCCVGDGDSLLIEWDDLDSVRWGEC